MPGARRPFFVDGATRSARNYSQKPPCVEHTLPVDRQVLQVKVSPRMLFLV